MTLTVRDVALRTPVTVLPEESICDAEQKLISQSASEIYVLDGSEMLLGVVPDYEILKYRLLGGDGNTRISALMTPINVSLSLASSLDAGARLLREHVHASVPVIEGGRLIGQLCRSNLLRIFAELGYRPSSESFTAAAAYLPQPKFTSTLRTSRHSSTLMR